MASDLTTAPIPALIRRLAIPAGTGFLFTTMFNVVDIWYGSRLSTNALAAMSLSFPVFFILLAIGTGASTSATALIGNALGRKEPAEARIFVLQALSFGLLHAIMLAVSALYLLPTIFTTMGARGEYLELALQYMTVIMIGAPFFMLNFVLSSILNSHGDTITYRNFLIVGFFLNCLLDPWLMYGGIGIPPLGLSGIAMSTVVIQAMGNLFLVNRLSKSGIIIRFSFKELLPRWHYFRELFRQGFPAAMNMMTVSIGIFIITWYAGRYGHQAVAAYGIATRIEQIALLPVMGLNVSTLALTAQNYGAERFDRIRLTLSTSLRYGFILASIGTLVAFFFTKPLIRFFTADSEVVGFAVQCLQVEAFVFPGYVILYVCVSAMQGVKRPAFALWIGLYRQIIGPLAIFHLLTTIIGLGVVGIWWGVFGITWSAAIIVALYVTWSIGKLEKEMQII